MNDEQDWKRYLMMAASGGLTGAAMGGIGKLLGGSRSLPAILGTAALGGATGATAIPGAAMLGETVLGAPRDEENQPYTLRAGLGGAAVGGIGGAALGGLAGAGLASRAAEAAPTIAKGIGKALPLDNMLVDLIKRSGGKKGALLGALLGAGGLGYMSADEGQQLDTIRNLAKQAKGEQP